MNIKIKIKDESGVALVVALLIMVILTILGTAAIMTSTTDVKIAGNFKKSTNAFYAAEAGIEAGMLYLESNFSPTTGWNTLLTTYIYGDSSSGTALSTDAKASYAVQVFDDEDEIVEGSGNWYTDAAGNRVIGWNVTSENDGGIVTTDDNRQIILRSTGRYGSSIVTLDAYIEFDPGYNSYGGKDLTTGNTNVAGGEATWG